MAPSLSRLAEPNSEMPAYRKDCLRAVAMRGKFTPDVAQDHILTASGMVGNQSLELTGRSSSEDERVGGHVEVAGQFADVGAVQRAFAAEHLEITRSSVANSPSWLSFLRATS